MDQEDGHDPRPTTKKMQESISLAITEVGIDSARSLRSDLEALTHMVAGGAKSDPDDIMDYVNQGLKGTSWIEEWRLDPSAYTRRISALEGLQLLESARDVYDPNRYPTDTSSG